MDRHTGPPPRPTRLLLTQQPPQQHGGMAPPIPQIPPTPPPITSTRPRRVVISQEEQRRSTILAGFLPLLLLPNLSTAVLPLANRRDPPERFPGSSRSLHCRSRGSQRSVRTPRSHLRLHPSPRNRGVPTKSPRMSCSPRHHWWAREGAAEGPTRPRAEEVGGAERGSLVRRCLRGAS